jgi:hypothetical protein
MKSVKILLALCCIFLLTSSRPVYNNSNEISSFKTLTDLSGDDVFVSTVNDLLAVQAKIFAANSAELMIRNAQGTLTEAEKNILAVNLGYADYKAMNNSLFSIGSSILALKNKYAELNNESTSASVIKFSIDRMQQEGKIRNAVGIDIHECFRQLYAAIVSCIKNSQTRQQFILCIQAAYAQFNVCIHQ